MAHDEIFVRILAQFERQKTLFSIPIRVFYVMLEIDRRHTVPLQYYTHIKTIQIFLGRGESKTENNIFLHTVSISQNETTTKETTNRFVWILRY
jgi:hypothetical protein